MRVANENFLEELGGHGPCLSLLPSTLDLSQLLSVFVQLDVFLEADRVRNLRLACVEPSRLPLNLEV